MNRISCALLVLLAALAAAPLGAQRRLPATPSPHGPVFQDCWNCHRSDSWRPAKISRDFRHSARFPLQGAHAAVTCVSCHLKLDFSGASANCASCHTDPHLGELGNDCARCHTTTSFVDRAAMLRTHQMTRFPLVGAHRMADCESCHLPAAQGQRRFAGRPTDCVSCHQRQLLATKSPDHVAAGFSMNCGSCHTPTFWTRAAFDHSGTSFPLTGAHRVQPCSACHADGVYGGKPSTCVSCHLTDYQNTTNPNHTGIGFPTDCASCHTTARWEGATFNHDPFFPIYSGKHRGVWSSCSTCHVNASDYKVYTCGSCHSQSSMADKHQNISGYQWNPPTCMQCHRDGTKP